MCTRDGAVITVSVCWKCHSKYTGGNEVSVSQFIMMRDSQYDCKSEVNSLPNSMFDHMVVETFPKLREERGLVLPKSKI